MAKETRAQNCSNCEYCVNVAANRRFRCTALPSNPGNYWDGFPENHWCGVYWTPKKSEKTINKSIQESK